MSVDQLAVGWDRLCLAGGSVEPAVPSEHLVAALEDNIELFRPLLPMGYEAVAQAYRREAAQTTAADLSNHYTTGLAWFREEFVPHTTCLLKELSGGQWDLSEYEAFAAGSDVDFLTHVVEAIAARQSVSLFPGDWFGFLVGSTHQSRIRWTRHSQGNLACLCIPSVRNGHVTSEMLEFLHESEACLLNLNLYPTLTASERCSVSKALAPVLEKSILSISFSRGFGLTASQLGVVLVHPEHPYRKQFAQQWEWYTYFYNAIAARTFRAVEVEALQRVDNLRRDWVTQWLQARGLPVVSSGSYYVKSFRPTTTVLPQLKPLCRDGIVRLCFKPPQVG